MSRNAFAQCASELEEREDYRHDCAAERLLHKKKLMKLAAHEAEEREAIRTECLPVVAQGLAIRDRFALKAPAELRARAVASLS